MTGDRSDPRDTMSPAVRGEYEAIVSQIVLERGQVVREAPTEYGWADQELQTWRVRGGRYDRVDHLSTCEVVGFGRLVERAEWLEFVGTFAPGGPTRTVYGIEVHDVTCACRAVHRRIVRHEAQVSDLIGAVITRVFERVDRLKSDS